MFLAWSLILTGINYARHRHMQYVLLEFFHASVDNSLTLICRRRNANIFQQVQIKRYLSSKCTLYKAPSAPSINQSDSFSSWDENEEVLYRNENEEVLVKYGKIILQKREWKFHSSITVFDQPEHIFFIVQVSEQEFISAERHGQRQFIDDSARSIAQHHNNSLLFLYETSFENFQNIVFNWSEKALFKDSAVVEELYSIDSESLLAAEKLSPSFPNSKSSNSIKSHAFPSSIQFTASDLQTTSQQDGCSKMSLSRCSFQSHTSSTSNVSDTSISIFTNNDCNQQPYSLLEALYFKELFGKHSYNEDSLISNRLKLHAEKISTKSINKSDTCLPEYSDNYQSSSQSKRTEEKRENTSTKSSYGRYILDGHSRSMSPSTKSVFATKTAENSGMQWENSSYSTSILPNYFCKLRQESYTTHSNTQSLEQTETGSTHARDTVDVGVSPSTTLNDVSDCLLLDSKILRHSEEISHDSAAAENKLLATKTQAKANQVGKKGQSILMAYPLLTKSATPTTLNQLIEEHKSLLMGSTKMLDDDNAHSCCSCSKSTCKADEQQKVAMDAAEDSLGMSLTQISEEKPSCSFAVNIKSTLPLLNKRKLLAKRFNSLEQPELDDPNFNYSMQFYNNNTDTDNASAATTATSNRAKKRLSVSSVSGRSVSPLTLSLLANYGSREVLDPLLSANAAQPDSFLFSRRASSRNHRRFHSSEPRRSTLCLTDSGYKSILKSSLSSPKAPEGMHSVFETANRPFKPPYILVYTGDETELFQRISTSLKGILPLDIYTVNHLSTEFLINYPWFDTNCTCLLISNTKHLDDQAWSRLQAYFVNVNNHQNIMNFHRKVSAYPHQDHVLPASMGYFHMG